jgi:hypothetical protein
MKEVIEIAAYTAIDPNLVQCDSEGIDIDGSSMPSVIAATAHLYVTITRCAAPNLVPGTSIESM